MSCPYYWYDHHYACRKSGKDVNEDIYSKYCRNYDYDDCPIYKGQDSSGCFLTSACTEARGLPDNCYELTVLRSFRDRYIKALPEGPSEIAEYYFYAPQIVDAIRKSPSPALAFDKIYTSLVTPCVQMIERHDYDAAHSLYRSAFLFLRERYL